MATNRALETNLVVSNDTAELSSVREFVKYGVTAGGFPEADTNRIMVAVDEAVTNIVEHAFMGVPTGDGEISMRQTVDATTYCISIEDNGLSFNKNSIKDIDIKEHVSAGHSGGLGIFFMRRVMDVVDYQYEQNVCNRLLLIKYAQTADV